MPLPYPHNTIWYVEASSEDGNFRSCGSAVAVCLQKRDQPATRRKYLLTCAHIIRGSDGCGPLLPKIEAWGPDTGYSVESKSTATIAIDIKAVNAGAVATEARSNAADDWLVLQLRNPQASQAMDAIGTWATATRGEVLVLGYPGGKQSFVQGKVVPTEGDDLKFRDLYHGIVRLRGVETRPGMSGGGLFDRRDRLIGIHRARADELLQCHSVSIGTIVETLHASGYEFGVNRITNPVSWRRATAILVTFTIALGMILALGRSIDCDKEPAPSAETNSPLPTPLPAPAYVTCRLFDAATHDPIEKEFTLTNSSQEGYSKRCVSRQGCQIPASLLDPIDHVQIECEGYLPRPDVSIKPDRQLPVDDNIRMFYMTRGRSYKESISPEKPPDLPTTDELNDHEPLDIFKLYVRNDTPFHPDILLYPLHDSKPSLREGREGMIDRFKIIEGKDLKGERGKYVELGHLLHDKSMIGFVVYVSFFGETARKVDEVLYFSFDYCTIDINAHGDAQVVWGESDPKLNTAGQETFD